MSDRERERQRLMRVCRRIIAEIESLMRDMAEWNQTNPQHDPIDPDPDLSMLFEYCEIKDRLAELEAQGVQ